MSEDTKPVRPGHQDLDRLDGAILAHFNMKVDDLLSEVFAGIDEYCRRHPEITEEIAKSTLSKRACDMAEGYEIWIEEGANG